VLYIEQIFSIFENVLFSRQTSKVLFARWFGEYAMNKIDSFFDVSGAPSKSGLYWYKSSALQALRAFIVVNYFLCDHLILRFFSYFLQ